MCRGFETVRLGGGVRVGASVDVMAPNRNRTGPVPWHRWSPV